jgi:hypothetical protein
MNKLTLLIILTAILGSCKTNQKNTISDSIEFSYPKTILPNDTTKLWVEDGNIESDTVLIVCQGGPSKNLTFIEKGRTSYRYIPNYSNYRIAYLHQAQTLNKEMFAYKEKFTPEMAEKEVDNTSEMLYRALNYFKTKGKTSIVIGTSYGAYIIPNYLSTRPSLADKYIIIAGRIDDNRQMLEQHLKGFNGEFEEDGITYVPEDENADLSEYQESEIKEYRVKQLLKGAIGKPRYSQELADKDLSNVIYFYATNDQNVGRLTASEIKFLESKKVKIFETNTGHSETLYRFIDKLMDGSLKL